MYLPMGKIKTVNLKKKFQRVTAHKLFKHFDRLVVVKIKSLMSIVGCIQRSEHHNIDTVCGQLCCTSRQITERKYFENSFKYYSNA